jgi:hypothetical protein
MSLNDSAPRRGLFGRFAAALAITAAGAAPTQAATAQPDGPDWPGVLKARHRQVVDGINFNGGTPLQFAATFLSTNPAPGAALVVIVLRSAALPIALNDAIWEKYRIGEAGKIIDPETRTTAVRNPFLHPRPGVLPTDAMAIERLLAGGAIIGACNIALHGMSRALAHNAGVTADEAAAEWAANVVPGVSIIPSGTWGVNRAQEAGCTYCGGG